MACADQDRVYRLPVLRAHQVRSADGAAQVKAATGHLAGLNVAVMGCIVNGPGEMADADYGYVGKGGGKITLYRGRNPVKNVPQEQGVAELIALIKADGRWAEPPTGAEVPTYPFAKELTMA